MHDAGKRDELRAFDGPVEHAVRVIVAAVLETQHVFWSCRGATVKDRKKYQGC